MRYYRTSQLKCHIEEVVDTIINDVETYTTDEEQDDDITLVAVRVS